MFMFPGVEILFRKKTPKVDASTPINSNVTKA